MNGSALHQGKGLSAVRLGAEKRTHLVEHATEARSSGAVFEPAHRPISLFDLAMVLLQMVITDDPTENQMAPVLTEPSGNLLDNQV
jgi:hypothetical protein